MSNDTPAPVIPEAIDPNALARLEALEVTVAELRARLDQAPPIVPDPWDLDEVVTAVSAIVMRKLRAGIDTRALRIVDPAGLWHLSITRDGIEVAETDRGDHLVVRAGGLSLEADGAGYFLAHRTSSGADLHLGDMNDLAASVFLSAGGDEGTSVVHVHGGGPVDAAHPAAELRASSAWREGEHGAPGSVKFGAFFGAGDERGQHFEGDQFDS